MRITESCVVPELRQKRRLATQSAGWRLAALARLRSSSRLLTRLRLVCLSLALASLVGMVPMLLDSGQPPVMRLFAVGLAAGLGLYWVLGFRRGGFPLAGEVPEVLAVFVLMWVASGNPLLPLFGLTLHSLYGGPVRAWERYALWMAALLSAHAARGMGQLDGDLARALGTAMVPGFMQIIKSSTEALEASERRLASLVQNSTDVVTVVGEDLRVRWQAESIRGSLGLEPSDVLGTPVLDLVDARDRAKLGRYFEEARGQGGLTRTLALRLRHRDGECRQFEVVAANRIHDRSVGGFVLNMRDATNRLRLERDLRTLASERERDALVDPLTGLANRRSLFDALDSEIARAGEERHKFALMLIDLDRFKELNDTLGHHVGDELLREIGPRLHSASRRPRLVARLGGDEFAVLSSFKGRGEDIEEHAEELRALIERPFVFQGLSLLVEASVGIAIYPDHAVDPKLLLQRADVAMYAAKRQRLGHALYRPDRDEHSRDRLALLGELPRAIAARELVLHYQPKFDLQTDQICGVEALVRWEHPERGLLFPGSFLSVAEQTGLMRPLTLSVLDSSLQQCARWQEEGISMPVAVNLSAHNLLDAGLAGDVDRLLGRWGLDPSYLQLEVTERMVGADPIRIAEVLAELRARGVSLALDDFGTGSSSLSFLRRLPVQELKIDKSFVLAAASGSNEDAAIVRAIITMARDLGLRSLAEGIEIPSIRAQLSDWGCEQGQGFGLARPMSGEAVTELIRRHQGRSVAAVPSRSPILMMAGVPLADR